MQHFKTVWLSFFCSVTGHTVHFYLYTASKHMNCTIFGYCHVLYLHSYVLSGVAVDNRSYVDYSILNSE